MKKAIVLGAGMVGSVMAVDLASDGAFDVTVSDARPDALERVKKLAKLNVKHADLGKPEAVRELVAGYDLVLGALSSTIGLQTLRAVIEAKKPYVDISFMAEDALSLDGFAREHGVTAVVDCGVAPGLSNMLCGFAATDLEPCESLAIYVGGLPVIRTKPYEYKAGFAPHDVIEEYVRPSRIVENGKMVVREALTEIEPMDLPHVGTVEAFNTDGLRSLATTLSVPDMVEKTLRYPGHVALMKAMRDTGLFSKELVEVGGVKVRPLDVTAKLLFPKWTYEDGEADLTVMRVEAVGMKAGKRVRQVWDLFDVLDPKTRFRSMSRTTAFPATIVARMLAKGDFVRPGVHAPEVLGKEKGILAHVLEGLAARGVRVEHRVEAL